MNVVLFYLGRKGAGPEYAIEMTKALSLKANLLCVISSYISNRQDWLLLAENNKNVSLKEVKTFNSKTEFILRSLNIANFFKIINVINKFNPDFIYTPMGNAWDRFIIPFCHCKHTVKTIHDVILHKGEDSFIRKTRRKLLNYTAEKYVILSNTFKDTLVKQGVSESNIIIIPHAVFKGYNKGPIFEDYKQYNRILFFGRIVKYKGIEVLLSAMKNISMMNPDIILSVVGNGDIQPYNSLIVDCAKNVELHIGWVEDADVANHFEHVDMIIVPYTHASQSGVIPLSYAFGKPVVATRIGGLPEQVVEGKTGVIVPADNIQSLSDEILALYKSPEKLEKLKRNCYEYARKNTWESSADILIKAMLSNFK